MLQFADKIALVNGVEASGKQVTFGEMRAAIRRVASGLQRLGIQRGDTLAVVSPNSNEFLCVLLAAICNGAAVATISPAYTAYEMAPLLKLCNPSYVFTVSRCYRTVTQAAAERGIVKFKTILVDEEAGSSVPADCIPFSSLLADDGSCYPDGVRINVREDTALILFSSGTTGQSKAVMLTHYNVVASITIYSHPDIRGQPLPGQNSVMLSVLPYCHAYGLMTQLMSLAHGVMTVTLPTFRVDDVLRCIDKYKVTLLRLVPPMILQLARSQLVSSSGRRYDVSSVRELHSGAAPLSRQAQLEFQTTFKLLNTRQGYGMTEMTLGTMRTPVTYPVKDGSVGVPLPNTEAQVVDVESGEVLGPMARGELCVRGPTIMKGYLNNSAATRDIIDADGWLHTGDVAYYDQDGYFYIVDRFKELIKYKGFQVPPAELESLLLTHPLILDAAVVAVPDAEAGQLPRAVVVPRPGAQLSATDVMQFVAEKVSSFKRLRGGVVFVDSIPRTESGKILRRVLQQLRGPDSKL